VGTSRTDSVARGAAELIGAGPRGGARPAGPPPSSRGRRRRSVAAGLVAEGLLAILFLLPVSSRSAPLAAQAANTGGGFAALVNGEPITHYELEEHVRRRILAYSSRYPDQLLEGQAEKIRGDVLRELVTERLLLQRCDRDKIEIRPEEIDLWVQSRIEDLRTQDDSIQTVGDFFDRWEADFGENEEQARQQIRNQLRIRRLLDTKIYQQEYISPAELRAHYVRNPQEFATESHYAFRQIILPSDDPDVRDILAAIDRDIAAGRDFGEMIAETSRGPRASEGGRYELTEKQLSSWYPPIPETLRALPVGAISTPLRAASRIHIVQMLEHRPGTQLAFAECQQEIRVRLRRLREDLQRENFEDDLRRNADVRVFLVTGDEARNQPK
jgi:parvulin-like peptidyl-prolyl isomerase